MSFFLMSQGSLHPKIRFPRSKSVLGSSCTDRQTHRNVNSEDMLSGFQEFFHQLIIKKWLIQMSWRMIQHLKFLSYVNIIGTKMHKSMFCNLGAIANVFIAKILNIILYPLFDLPLYKKRLLYVYIKNSWIIYTNPPRYWARRWAFFVSRS